MGEYFQWVNVDKKEYLAPSDFNLGSKLHESMYKGNPLLLALRELLFNEWRGDRIVFLGDECGMPDNVAIELFQSLYLHSVQAGYEGDFLDTICESYRNVSCFFKEAESEVREEINYYLKDRENDAFPRYNEYGIDAERPFDGLFLRSGKNFRYTINFTKKACYSFGTTRILYSDHSECVYSDPLPILMSYGRSKKAGPWVGDIIGVADEINQDFNILQEIYLDW